MRLQQTIIWLALLAALFSGRAAFAETETQEEPTKGEQTETKKAAESDPGLGLEQIWSATLIADFTFTDSPWNTSERGGFFDKYEWTPNKGSAFPLELGIRDLAWDLLDGDGTALLQLRYRSPTSNLGISGSQIDQPFLNQRAEIFAGHHGADFEFQYWRFRTEELRLFPTTAGRSFIDLTNPDDRFTHDRTGFLGQLRVRGQDLWGNPSTGIGHLLDPTLSLRGGYDARSGSRQLRFMLSPANDWISITQPLNQDVAKVGGGLLVVPGGLFTLAFDVDYKSFRNDPTILQNSVAPTVPPPDKTIGFIPDTDQIVGTVQLQGHVGERAVLEGGFQVTRLEQVESFTPDQISNQLVDNALLYYSANVTAKVQLSDAWSSHAFVKFDQRQNQINRDTALFNSQNGSQVDPFMKKRTRVNAGAELAFELAPRNRLALGARYEWIDRDLDFPPPVTTNPAILAPNALIGDETKMWTVYGRTRLRPYKGIMFSGELGYRGAPATAYVSDLNDYVYGKLRASYVVPLTRPIVLSAYAQGGTGKNNDFVMVNGIGPTPSGARTPKTMERSDYLWGITATSAPWKDLTVFASFFCARDTQDYGLVLSNLQRYFQTTQSIFFQLDGMPQFENEQKSLIVGLHSRLLEDSDAGLSYSFTHASAKYNAAIPSADVAAIAASSIVDTNVHGLQFEAGHWLRDGLRVLVGYRLQLLDDQSPVPAGTGSIVPPLSLSTTQHTLTLGVTLTNELFAKSD